MLTVHAASVALNQTPLDWGGNRDRIVGALDDARKSGARVVCLPELCVTGYGCEDAFQSPGVQEEALKVLIDELVPATKGGMVACFGLPLLFQNALYNVAALAVDGVLVGFVPKQHLAGDGLHYEPRWFKPWPAKVVREVTVRGVDLPLGDLVFDVGGVRFGFEICEDAWVAGRPGAELARRGVDVVMNPSASHFAFGKHRIRERFVIEGSRAFNASYLYANLLGNEAGRAIYDGDTMIASSGEVLARGKRFSFRDYEVVDAVIDVGLTRMRQSKTVSYRPSLEEPAGTVVRADLSWGGPWETASTAVGELDDWEDSDRIKEEEFARAVALGLFDYCRKSHSKGFVVSLSGGADSAACAVLVWLMSRIASIDLGGEKELGEKLGLENVSMASLLTTVYQSTRNSGEVTREAAAKVAEALGATHYEFDVDPLVEGYRDIVEKALGRDLTWKRDDIALQNIQARVRSPAVWMLANIGGGLLLSTSNRSEAAVGYATMDGDTSGGLSPIAGIDKAFLREWLRWMEESGPEGVGEVSALGCVNRQEPTAELRPQSSGQTDEGDLMPYPVLDAIERLAIRDKKMPVEVWRTLCQRLDGHYVPADLKVWVRRFYQLWSRNQWKRERYAPSFHLDDENLDPKTWCRFPILSSGFVRELAALEVEKA